MRLRYWPHYRPLCSHFQQVFPPILFTCLLQISIVHEKQFWFSPFSTPSTFSIILSSLTNEMRGWRHPSLEFGTQACVLQVSKKVRKIRVWNKVPWLGNLLVTVNWLPRISEITCMILEQKCSPPVKRLGRKGDSQGKVVKRSLLLSGAIFQVGPKGAYYSWRTVTGWFCVSAAHPGPREAPGALAWGCQAGVGVGRSLPTRGCRGWGVQAAHPRLHTCGSKWGKGDPSSDGAGSRGSTAAARPSPRTVPEGTARKESLPAHGPLNCPQTRSCQPPPERGTSLRSAARDGGGAEAPPPRSALLRGPAWAVKPEAGARQGRSGACSHAHGPAGSAHHLAAPPSLARETVTHGPEGFPVQLAHCLCLFLNKINCWF